MVGARKTPQSHIHKPPEERNKGSIKYIQSCGEIRSFCCVWWRKAEMAGKRKDQPTLSVSIIWEIVGFHFHRKVKTTWLTSQRVKPVLKGCDCGKMFPLFPSNAPSQHTNTFTSQYTNNFTSQNTNTFSSQQTNTFSSQHTNNFTSAAKQKIKLMQLQSCGTPQYYRGEADTFRHFI